MLVTWVVVTAQAKEVAVQMKRAVRVPRREAVVQTKRAVKAPLRVEVAVLRAGRELWRGEVVMERCSGTGRIRHRILRLEERVVVGEGQRERLGRTHFELLVLLVKAHGRLLERKWVVVVRWVVAGEV